MTLFSYILLGVLLVFLFVIFASFRPAGTRKIAEDIYAVNCGFVNFYAVNTAEGVLLFDAGMNPGMARRGLKKLGFAPEGVTHIFLTHSDYDHAGGRGAFEQAEVYLS